MYKRQLKDSPSIEHAGLFAGLRATQPLTPKDSATDAVACQEAGQGDSQAKRQGQPKEGYEGNAPFPASRVFEIVPKVLKNGLFLPDKLAQPNRPGPSKI